MEVTPLPGLPEVEKGDDLVTLIVQAATRSGVGLRSRDILVVKQKVVSKAEGRTVKLSSVRPGLRATKLAREQGKDPRIVELILRESKRIVRVGHGVIITETKHGYVCANSGVDRSNVKAGYAALLPVDPDRSARNLRNGIERRTGKKIAVVITDTFGRPWRNGQTDVAIGCSGISPLRSYVGRKDRFGYSLRVTAPATVDELAGAAELLTGKLTHIPVAVIRGLKYERGDEGAASLVMDRALDLFR
jgi:coenzyme F420-0:L-glutamate ligase/coenzyme F420-1:gamma-L-glutamate ligase